MAVGSVSKKLLDYEESDTYLSRDAGATWVQVRRGAHKHAFADQGNIMVLVDDEKSTDHVRYSTDSGETWYVPSVFSLTMSLTFRRQKLDLGVTLRAMVLTSAPGVTSHSLILLGALQRGDSKEKKRYALIHLDFGYLRTRECGENDVEKWYARGVNATDCIMGQKVVDQIWRPLVTDKPYTSNGFGGGNRERIVIWGINAGNPTQMSNTACARTLIMAGANYVPPTRYLTHSSF